VVRESVDGSALLGCDGGWEDQCLATSVSFEEHEVSVETEGRWIVQVEI